MTNVRTYDGYILGGGLVLGGFYIVSLHNYLLFHSLVEMLSIGVAWSTFMLAWNARRFLDNNYVLLIGIAFSCVGAISLLHTLAYKGMGVFQGYDANLPTQLWIAARYLQSFSFLVAPLAFRRRLDVNRVLAAYILITGLLAASIFWNVFPTCYIEGRGLTLFKIVSEYIICLIFLAALAGLLYHRAEFDAIVLRLLAASIVVSIGSDLAFTSYFSVYGPANLVGHLLGLIAVYLIYKAVVETGLEKPYTLLFRNLKRSEERLQKERDFTSAILNTAGALVVVLDRQGRIVRFNHACEQSTGYAFEEVEGRCFWDFLLLPEEVEPVKAVFAELKGGDFPNKHENFWVARDGSRRLIAWTNTSLFNEEGQVEYIIGTGLDITVRVQAEEALRRLVSGTSSATNALFFETLVRELAEWLGIRWALVGELDPAQPDRVRPLAFWSDGQLVAAESYGLSGTPCEQVQQRGFCLFPAQLVECFPEDEMIVSLGAAWYAGVPLYDSEGQVVGILCALHDRTIEPPPNIAEVFSIFSHRAGVEIVRQRVEAQREAALAQREWLVRDTYHRVKNNLMVVESLLNLQSANIQDERMRALFKESQTRVRSMLLIHEKLHQSRDLSRVELGAYLRKLAVDLFRAYRSPAAPVELVLDVEEVFLSADQATSCGLIVNELISNALKHAFPPAQANEESEICLGLHTDGEQYVLTVSDNGRGLPEGIDFTDFSGMDSLGMQIVAMKVSDLGGVMEIDRNSGTTFRITFGREDDKS